MDRRDVAGDENIRVIVNTKSAGSKDSASNAEGSPYGGGGRGGGYGYDPKDTVVTKAGEGITGMVDIRLL
jgi:hypothetical protein